MTGPAPVVPAAPVAPAALLAASHASAERAARESYGRLLAILSARTHDIAASEDALADAFARALERWPADGVPQQPDAWLLSVARHRKLDAWRHTRVQDEATQTLMLLAGEVDGGAAEGAAVPDGIYAAYGTGWDDVDGADALPRGLAAEAIDLCRILCRLMPREPEPPGLLALMLFCDARMAARRSDSGAYVPLDQQDITRWNHELLAEAEHQLRQACAMGVLGAYQLEAAIQSAHCERRAGAPVPPETLVSLYEGLLALRPSIGAQVSLACALANARGPEAGLQALDAIPSNDVTSYQPFWAARAHLLATGGARAAARQAYERAIGLSTSAVVRTYLDAMSRRP